MALATLPYKCKITSRSTTASGTALGFTVTDAMGVTRASSTVNVTNNATLEEVLARMREKIDVAMIADAGSRAALLDAIITAAFLFIP